MRGRVLIGWLAICGSLEALGMAAWKGWPLIGYLAAVLLSVGYLRIAYRSLRSQVKLNR
jgi:divalent metal cation (Fe/Co/Zn/Cd) transporter